MKYLISAIIAVLIFMFMLMLTPLFSEGKADPGVQNVQKVTRVESIEKEVKEVKKFMKEAENPDTGFESKAKNLARKFFSDTGIKIMVAICLFLSIVFFFRLRNYVMALVFYVIANILTFFGYKVAQWIFR